MALLACVETTVCCITLMALLSVYGIRWWLLRKERKIVTVEILPCATVVLNVMNTTMLLITSLHPIVDNNAGNSVGSQLTTAGN